MPPEATDPSPTSYPINNLSPRHVRNTIGAHRRACEKDQARVGWTVRLPNGELKQSLFATATRLSCKRQIHSLHHVDEGRCVVMRQHHGSILGATQDSYHMRLIRAAPTIAPQTAADATLIRTTAARKAKQSSSPSSSKYARATSAITVAGAILLNGTGVRSNAAVSNRITTPTKCLAASKAVILLRAAESQRRPMSGCRIPVKLTAAHEPPGDVGR